MPSKKKTKDALQKLMRAPGSPDEIWDDLLGSSDPKERLAKAVGGMKKYDDRAAVLVFQSMLEQYLEYAIASVMKVPEKDMPTLFGYDEEKGPGPIGSFRLKIDKGLELGLYEESMAADLRMIKLIRNVFAHARVQIDFLHEAVKDGCDALIVAKNIKEVGLEVGHRCKAWAAKVLTSRQKYTGSIAVMTDMLKSYPQLPATDVAIIVRYERMYKKALNARIGAVTVT